MEGTKFGYSRIQEKKTPLYICGETTYDRYERNSYQLPSQNKALMNQCRMLVYLNCYSI
jgi:hypothetical protein